MGTAGPPPHARSSFRHWQESSPLLAAHSPPGDVVAAVTHSEQPTHSAALLAELLKLATSDELARYAVLAAVHPQLRSIATRRWKLAYGDGVWLERRDLDSEVISLAWLAIENASGQFATRPPQSVVRQVERQLRTIHESYRRTLRCSVPFHPQLAPVQPDGSESPFLETATTRLVDAVHAGQLDPLDAATAYQVGVAGLPVVRVSERFGLTRASARRSLRAARDAMETRRIHPPVTPTRKEAARMPVNGPTPFRCYSPFSRPASSSASAAPPSTSSWTPGNFRRSTSAAVAGYPCKPPTTMSLASVPTSSR